MLSTLNMRNQTIKFSALSQLNPDYYFIQGYFMGIGANPHLIKTSQWMMDLFGEVDFGEGEQTEYVQALMQLYNVCMKNIMQLDIKLPTKCALSKANFENSLAPNAPLPNWCLGMLKALKLIDEKTLNEHQSRELRYTRYSLTVFISLEHAKKVRFSSDGYEAEVHREKRLLSTFIHNLIFSFRFSDYATTSIKTDIEAPQEESPEDFQAMMHFVMTESNVVVDQTIEMLISVFENEYTDEYLADHKGHLWNIYEARPYMVLRARRAQLNFQRGDISTAIDELNVLLGLNPGDNQANRYPLANYLVIEKRWDELSALLQEYEEKSMFMLASEALMLFAQEGDSVDARVVKNALKKENKHLEKYLTGQSKAPKVAPEMYSSGDKTEVFTYLSIGAKETWRSIQGSLFWLRRK
jgi:hypothetical protein